MIRLFRVSVPAGILTLLVSEGVLLIVVFILASYVALGVDPTVFLLNDGGLTRVLIAVGFIVLGLHFRDLYENIYIPSRIALIQQLCQAIGIAFIAQGLTNSLAPELGLPLKIAVSGFPLALVAIFAWRLFFSAMALEVVGRSRLLLAGSNPLLMEIARRVEAPPHGTLATGGYVDDRYPAGTQLPGGVVCGPMASLLEIARETRARRIVIGLQPEHSSAAAGSLLTLRSAGWSIEEAAAVHEQICGRVSLAALQPALLFTRQFEPAPQLVALHGFANCVAAALAILVLSPLMLLTAALVRFTAGGPVLKKDRRAGLEGAPFTLLRFKLPAPGSSRTSRMAAAVIRRLRLESLPQLFNVLRGEMAFVGPSPERVEFGETLSGLIPPYRGRHSVRPGITGWRRIKSATRDAVTELEYDLYYIKHASFTLDVVIGFQALKAAVLGR